VKPKLRTQTAPKKVNAMESDQPQAKPKCERFWTLPTADPDRAQQFYHALFGWDLTLSPRDASGYLHIRNAGQWIGGIPPAVDRHPPTPPHWMVWFQVPDCDAAVAAAAGAHILSPPRSMERVGRIAVLADPQGADFGLITPPA